MKHTTSILVLADAQGARYDALASILADDRIYLRSNASSCSTYLAVELDATEVVPNSDCGGRDPTLDVVDLMDSVTITGMYSGVDDGVSGSNAASATIFPFLAPPH